MERHEKWKRVEAGEIIPAGQPYSLDYEHAANGMTRADYVMETDHTAGFYSTMRDVWELGDRVTAVFVDSSWKPPLVLPTEPTWGIAVHSDGTGIWLDTWERHDVRIVGTSRNGDLPIDVLSDLILLTDEQVARIEAAR